MNPSNVSINELNSLLKGENMASDSFEKIIGRVNCECAKGKLQKIQQNHKQHAIKLEKRIQDLGGTPVNGVGFVGKTVEVVSGIKDLKKKSNKEYVEEILIGEENGIKMAREMIIANLDPVSSKLVNGILNEDSNHIMSLQEIINSNNPQL